MTGYQADKPPPHKVTLAIEARWVVPVIPRKQVWERYSVICNDEVIVDILPIEEARNLYLAEQTIILDEHVLIPGLINLHTHAAMCLMRGLADDLPLMPWLEQHIWPAERLHVSERFTRDGSLLACAEMLKGGITCFNDMYFFPQGTADAASQAGMRVNLGLVVLDFASAYANDPDDYLQKGLDARDSWRNNPLISSSLAPHAPYTISDKTFEKVLTYAEQISVGIHTHLHETEHEIDLSMRQFGKRPIQRLLEIGVLGPNFVAAHCVYLSVEEMNIFAEHGCHVAHCPASNLKLASGIAPIHALLAKQVGIGLGTDGAASNNRLDILAEMRLAALLAKGASGDATILPAHDALAMATIQGARAMCLESKIGSIEVGKLADLTAVRMADIETLPCFDPVSHLVYVTGREHVSHVWVNGELRYQKINAQDGVYANIEPLELKEISASWQSRLSAYK